MKITEQAVRAAVVAMNTNNLVAYDSLIAQQEANARSILTAALPYMQPVAVPDVPELMRYSPKDYKQGMCFDSGGEYVRYDQAAEVIERLQIDASNHAHDAETVRRERDALITELAQIKAQEPVGYVKPISMQGLNHGNSGAIIISTSHNNKYSAPLYAAPVDQTAEIERLRSAAKKVIARWDSPHWKVTAPTADVMNELRDALSGKEPS